MEAAQENCVRVGLNCCKCSLADRTGEFHHRQEITKRMFGDPEIVVKF